MQELNKILKEIERHRKNVAAWKPHEIYYPEK